jgi:hypothetical protein
VPLPQVDLNGDGNPDLLNGGLVLLGDNEGSFERATNTFGGGLARIPNGPPVYVFGDFNGDGKLDKAYCAGWYEVRIALGIGNWSFGPEVGYPTGNRSGISSGDPPSWLGIGDFTNDGIADIVATSGLGSYGSILIGNGDGTFGSTIRTTYSTRAVVLQDVNEDGMADYVTPNVGLGDGTGSFPTGVPLDGGSPSRSIAVGDINGDGHVDIASVGLWDPSPAIWFGHGDGTFGGRVTPVVGSDPGGVAMGDLNGDGRIDLAFATAEGVSVILQDDQGSLGAPSYFGGPCRSLAIGDLNHDGDLDVASPSGILLGNGDGTFEAPNSWANGGTWASVTITDVNNDAQPDVFFGTGGGWLGNGDGTFNRYFSAGVGSNGFIPGGAVADLNGDGTQDVAMPNTDGGVITVVLGNGDGTFGHPIGYGVLEKYPLAVAIGDVNSDGRPDMASTGTIFLNTGSDPMYAEASVDLNPATLKASSQGRWISAFIEPAGFDARTIDVGTLRLAASIPADAKHAVIGDHDSNHVLDLMVKFDRQAVAAKLMAGDNHLSLTGATTAGAKFRGTAEIQLLENQVSSLVVNVQSPIGRVPVSIGIREPSSIPKRVSVYDVTGRLTTRWVERPGTGLILWDGRAGGHRVASGIYFVRVEDGNRAGTTKVVIAR